MLEVPAIAMGGHLDPYLSRTGELTDLSRCKLAGGNQLVVRAYRIHNNPRKLVFEIVTVLVVPIYTYIHVE